MRRISNCCCEILWTVRRTALTKKRILFVECCLELMIVSGWQVHGRSALGWAAHHRNGALVACLVSEGLASGGDLQRIEAGGGAPLCGPQSREGDSSLGGSTSGVGSDIDRGPPSLLRLAVCAVVAARLPRCVRVRGSRF